MQSLKHKLQIASLAALREAAERMTSFTSSALDSVAHVSLMLLERLELKGKKNSHLPYLVKMTLTQCGASYIYLILLSRMVSL